MRICDIDEAALARLEGRQDRLSGVRADVADPDQLASVFKTVAQDLGGLDVLVNNAGISGPTADTECIAPADWQRTIDVNLNGAFYCSRLAIPLLKASGGGSIINIGSTAGLHGYPLRAPYAASKWALIGFTKTMAMELGPSESASTPSAPVPSGDRASKVSMPPRPQRAASVLRKSVKHFTRRARCAR